MRDDEEVRAPSHESLLELALSAARAAGELLLDGQQRTLKVETKSSPTDVVSEMDHASEALLNEILRGARPQDGILGEEGSSVEGTSGLRWVVDPLDGTVNYLYGLANWAVSIGLEFDGEAIVGVVHAPMLGETFVGTLGGGARLLTAQGNEPLHVRACVDLASALVSTGFGYQAERRAAQAAVIAELLPQVRDLRRFGSCAIDLCWLAAGRVDAYYERGTHPWDHSAGALIAREAGARVEGLHAKPVTDELLVSAVPAIFPALHDLLTELGADSG